jgi:hypothetical protein
MRTRSLSTPDLRPALAFGGAASALTAVVLWTQILVREWPLLTAGGVICGADQGLLGHCAACYPAIAATAAASACAVALLAIRRP